MPRQLNKARLVPLLAGLAAVMLIAGLKLGGAFDRLDRIFWDEYQRLGSGRRPDPRVALVAIDQGSIDYFTHQGVLWPWPRDLWARLIEVAAEAGAEAVIFDMMFDDEGIDRLNSSGYYTDMAFAEALSGPLPVVIAASLERGEPPDSIPIGIRWAGRPMAGYNMPGLGLKLPHPRFRAARMGLANVEPDPDGVIRWLPPVFQCGQDALPTLSLQAAYQVTGDTLQPPRVDGKNRMWLRYYGAGGPAGAFPYISGAALITGQVPQGSLRGRILVVGSNAAGLLDYKPTPVGSPDQPYPGFEIQATALSNLLQGDGLTPSAAASSALLTVTAGLIGVAIVSLPVALWLQVVMLLLLFALVPVAGWGLFTTGTLLPAAGPLMAAVAGVGAKLYASWHFEGRQRHQLRRLFSRYLDDLVIEDLMSRPDELQMEGRQIRTTVLFADIVGFSTASEGLSPKDTVAVLNDYYKVLVEVMLKHRGLLDKYIGDAVMVLFGAPVRDAQTGERAAHAILEAMTQIDDLSRQRRTQGLPIVNIRIGAHTDNVVVGNIGHPRRMDYTAIGSGVNIASRLEGANRKLGTHNLVSSDFCADIPDTIPRREIGRVVLKGLTQPLAIWELMPDGDAGDWLRNWNWGWILWREDRREEALQIWQKIGGQRPDDLALKVLLERLSPLASSSGSDDDVLVFATK